MTENWKKEFVDRMSGYSEPLPDGFFEDIMTSVERRKRGRRTVLFLFSGVAAAAVMLFAVLPGRDSDVPAGQYFPLMADNGIHVAIPSPAELPGARPVPAHDPDAGRLEQQDLPQDDLISGDEPYEADRDVSGEVTDEMSGEVSDDVGQNIVDGAVVNEPADDDVAVRDGARDWQQLLLAENTGLREKRRAGFNVYASGLSAGSVRHSGYSQAVNAAAAAMPMRYGDNSLAGIMTFNRSKDVATESRHFLPLRAGIAFSWWLSPRWSIGSGVTYTWLLSKSRTGSESYYVDSRQSLHYLGIPLTVNYDIWNTDMLRVYVSAGGMLEKCVGGNVRSDYIYGNDVRSHDSARLVVRPLQWSVTASAGLQFNLSRMAGIYIEPGAAYHFYNGSDVETIYSDRPLNFSLNFGLRFMFD